MAEASGQRTPWHVWVVGVVSLLWNSFGCTDYTMLKTHNAHWIAAGKVPAELIARMDAAPLWGTTGWALGVWGSLVGSILLLARSRHAALAFALSFVGALVGFVWQFGAGMVQNPALPVMIEVAVALQWFYARSQVRAGNLR